MDRFQLQRAPTLSAQQIEERLSLQEMFSKFEHVQSKRQSNTLNVNYQSPQKIGSSVNTICYNNNMEQKLKMSQIISIYLRQYQSTQDSYQFHQSKDSTFVKRVTEFIGLEEQQQIKETTEANLKKLLKANPYFRKIKSIEQAKLLNQDNSDQTQIIEQKCQDQNQEDDTLNGIQDSMVIDQSDLDGDLDFDDSNSVSDCSSKEDSESIIIIKPLSRLQEQETKTQDKHDKNQYDKAEDTKLQNDDAWNQIGSAECQNEMNIDQTNSNEFKSKATGYRKKPLNAVDEFDFDSLNSMPTLDHF